MTPEQAVHNIRQRLSLRPPQAESLALLKRVVTEFNVLDQALPLTERLDAIRAAFPKVTDFERQFPSLCFALATGVGKTRLMGAFIAYLHQAHGLTNYFVLAPNLTIYNKLIGDFSPTHPKYVFRGLSEYTAYPPEVITGDDYAQKGQDWLGLQARIRINIFNISKINTEVRGGKTPRIKRLSEYLGQSYFDYLAGLPDLVLIMDESHRYRGSAGVQAINELAPRLGLELTATPFQEASPRPRPFKNVLYEYPLRRAMDDGFVKVPAVVTQRDFDASKYTADDLELIKLKDGVGLHEKTRAALATYALNYQKPSVKPFVLVIARDTEHAASLYATLTSDGFFEGRYREHVLQVDSSKISEDGVVERLLSVEKPDSPVEIVIHVNMLKEGWDVTNLYTIIPLRAAKARTLIEQTIGRGLRLPYGIKTGEREVDTLNIVAHDRFQEIIDEAGRPDSPIQQFEQIILDPTDRAGRLEVVQPVPILALTLGTEPVPVTVEGGAQVEIQPVFTSPIEQQAAAITVRVLHQMAADPETPLYRPTDVNDPEVQARVINEVARELYGDQKPLLDASSGGQPDLSAVVMKTASQLERHSIRIPRISVYPSVTVASGYRPFTLDLSAMRFQPVAQALVQTRLTDGDTTEIGIESAGTDGQSAESLIVERLALEDDVDYAATGAVLHDLAGQVMRHFEGYLGPDDSERVARQFLPEIVRQVHSQMQPHYWEDAPSYENVVTAQFVELQAPSFSREVGEPVCEPDKTPPDGRSITRYLYGGYRRCLFTRAKFRSDPERVLAMILDRYSEKWFQPAARQFRIKYRRQGGLDHDYIPDFVAEIPNVILMIEVKATDNLDDVDVQAKARAANTWCELATEAAAKSGLKPWRYLLIPDTSIQSNMSLDYLIQMSQWRPVKAAAE